MGSKKVQIFADLALVFVTLVWGATFVTVKEAIKHIEPFYFLAVRFGIATLLMLAISNRRLVKINGPSLLKGVLIGLALFSGYAFQTFGLKYTSASNAGFITGLSVVLVPLFITIVTKKLPALLSVLGIISATIGLGFLTVDESMQLNFGDILVLFCAVSFGLHILLLGKFSPDSDSFVLATVQIATVTLASFIAALIKETAPTAASFNTQVWEAILITAFFATALAFFLQTWTQKFTSPTHTAIIFTMEPAFAAVFAYLLGGELFTLRQGIGAGFILAGMLASEFGGHEPVREEVLSDIAKDSLKV